MWPFKSTKKNDEIAMGSSMYPNPSQIFAQNSAGSGDTETLVFSVLYHIY